MAIESTQTIYTVLDFLKWQRDGTLELRPPFQRYAVWRAVARSSLIDSLLRGYPIPALFLQDRSDPKTFTRRLVVVDGQQRLRTILGYLDVNSLPDADSRDVFTIMRIHDPDRAGKAYDELSEADQGRILSTRLNVNIVGSTVSDSELLEIFRRMNTFGSRLNAQELRNASFHGYYKEAAYRLASDSFDRWLDWGLFNRQEAAEMSDVAFASELMLLLLTGTQSSTKRSLDDVYKEYEEEFPEIDTVVERYRHLLDLNDSIFQQGAEVRRLRTKMWAYSLVDALQRVVYQGPIAQTDAKKPRRLPQRALAEAGKKANEAIEKGRLPVAVEFATRGAANDKASREARAQYLKRLLESASS
jgi:hypothetical protein